MAIKVEHEGNATSRIVASNLGGQAASSQQQSVAMSQKAANEFAAGNRQLSGAQAHAASPGSASASLTSAGSGIMNAPGYDVNFADEIAVGNDPDHQPSPTSYWKNGRWYEKNYYGKAGAQKKDEERNVTDVHDAALDRSKKANTAGQAIQDAITEAAGKPQVDDGSQPQSNEDVQLNDAKAITQFYLNMSDTAKRALIEKTNNLISQQQQQESVDKIGNFNPQQGDPLSPNDASSTGWSNGVGYGSNDTSFWKKNSNSVVAGGGGKLY